MNMDSMTGSDILETIQRFFRLHKSLCECNYVIKYSMTSITSVQQHDSWVSIPTHSHILSVLMKIWLKKLRVCARFHLLCYVNKKLTLS